MRNMPMLEFLGFKTISIRKIKSLLFVELRKRSALLKHIGEFIHGSDAAKTRAPHKVCNYIQKLAQCLTFILMTNKFGTEKNPQLSKERLALVEAIRVTLKML